MVCPAKKTQQTTQQPLDDFLHCSTYFLNLQGLGDNHGPGYKYHYPSFIALVHVFCSPKHKSSNAFRKKTQVAAWAFPGSWSLVTRVPAAAVRGGWGCVSWSGSWRRLGHVFRWNGGGNGVFICLFVKRYTQ